MRNEVWKDVVGYEGIYEVSNIGRVRTHENKTTFTELHGTRKWKQRILKQKVGKDNSCRVSLWKYGKEKTCLVHRLVAYAFIPLVEGKEHINHIDGVRLNNAVSNLEWCNQKENNNHAFDNNLIKTGKKIILKNRESGQRHYFRSMAKAGEFLGFNHGYISRMIKDNKRFVGCYEVEVSEEF